MKDRPLRIGELAAETGVSVTSLRYYERRKLIHPDRTGSGYRTYSPATVKLVRWIKSAQRAGFRLREIEELLRQRSDPSASCRDVCNAVAAKLSEIDTRARTLTSQATVLREVLERCDANERKSAAECGVWEELETRVAQ